MPVPRRSLHPTASVSCDADCAIACWEADMTLLAINNVEVVYDNVSLAVKGVSIDIEAGGLVALLGANGAGKSTVLKAISGLLSAERGKVSGGTITFDGIDLLGLSAPERVRRRSVHVLEGRRIFEHLTPAENLLAAS